MYGMEVDTQQDNQSGNYLELLPLDIQKAVLGCLDPKEEFEGGFIGEYEHDNEDNVALSFSPDGRYLASGAIFDDAVKLYDIQQRNVIDLYTHDGGIEDIKFSADGLFLKSHGRANTIIKYNIKEKALVQCDDPSRNVEVSKEAWDDELSQDAEVHKEVFSPDGRYRLTCNTDCEMELHNIEQNKRVDMNWEIGLSEVDSANFSPDSKYFANGWGGDVQLCDLKNNRDVTNLYSHSPHGVMSTCFSSDGNYLASSDFYNKVKVYDFVKLLVAHKRPEKFSSFKEYLLWLDLNKGELPKNIDQDEKNIFDALPEEIKERFRVKRDRSSVLQLNRARLSPQSDQNQK